MNTITTIIGSKETIMDDVRVYSEKFVNEPEIFIVAKKDIRNAVMEKVSSLFIQKNLIMVLLDPEKELLKAIEEQLLALREAMHVVIYFTTQPSDIKSLTGNKTIIMEKEKEKRIKDRVLALLKKHNKVMTDKAFKQFKERIKDEPMLESELMKLINYIGDKKEIKSGDVVSIVTGIQEESLLTFFDTIAHADKKETLSLLDNLLLSGLNMLAVQGFLVKQIRLMLQAKDMEEIFKVSPEYPVFSKTFNKWKENVELTPLEKKLYLPYQKTFYAYKLSRLSQKFSKRELGSLFDTFLYFDTKIKSGTKHERIHLEHILLEA